MATLLHVDSSPLGASSVTRNLSREYVEQWKAAHPDGRVIVRDLAATRFPVIDAAWIGAVYTPEEARTPEQTMARLEAGWPGPESAAVSSVRE